MRLEDLKFDCKHFLGHIPCKPNKLHDVACDSCTHYDILEEIHLVEDSKEDLIQNIFRICDFKADKIQLVDNTIDTDAKRILFIKLGAIGDVIRTTPLITRYKKEYGDCYFTWITHSPEVLPQDKVDKIYKWSADNVCEVANQEYDIAINLDKDEEACMLLAAVRADKKFGFIWKDNHINIATEKAEHKLITGLFDHISKKNTLNYLEEIFDICHFDFKKEEYMINLNEDLSGKWNNVFRQLSEGKRIIGLNTGCGERWQTRLWPKKYWVDLIGRLQRKGYFCLLMGGPQEHKMNSYYAKKTGATYLGSFSLEEFISITNSVDIIVTPVSMMMHIALALKKQLMLFHNIFNVHEFELYDRGVIIEPTSGCDCYFGNTCSRKKSCMYDVSVQDVLTNIVELNKNLNN